MPRSIVSTTSAWCSASRAAQLIASDGVVSATGSRCRGRAVDMSSRGSFSSRSTLRPTSPVKPTKTSASAMLKPRWKTTTCRCTPGTSCCSSTCACGTNGTANAAPSSLKIRLPSGSRRTCGAAPLVARIASRPLPTLAPSTRPSASGTGSSADAASDAISSTIARLEYDSTVSAAPTTMSQQHVVRQRDQQRAHRGRFGQRLGRADDQLQRQGDQPEADQHPADPPGAAVLARDEQQHADEDQERRQPRQVEREHQRHQAAADIGAEHHRERRARSSPARCRRTTRRSGRLRCSTAPASVTPSPASIARGRLLKLWVSTLRRFSPNTPQHAGAHDVRAPDQQRDRGQQIQQRQHGVRRPFAAVTSRATTAASRS